MKTITVILMLALLSMAALAVHYHVDPEPAVDAKRQTFQPAGSYKSPFNIENRIYSNTGEAPLTPRAGVSRVTNYDPRVSRVGAFGEIDRFVYLRPATESVFEGAGRGGYAPFYERGTAKIDSKTFYKGKAPVGRVTINTKDIPASERAKGYFEAWLVDDETGYRQYLGAFTTTFGGVGELKYFANTYFDVYDRVEVTFKAFGDPNFGPGEPVLTGDIPPLRPQPGYFNPPAKDSKMITGPIETI